MGFLEDLMAFLEQNQTDPVFYLLILFVFSILVAIILPIPIEIALIWNPSVPYFLKALVLGAGKGVGSLAVFVLGLKVEPAIRKWSKYRSFKWILDKCESFVARYGYIALYIILSIPLMTDTVPIYLFSIFNKEGTAMEWRMFGLVNFFAGVTRAAILWVLLMAFGIDLFR